MVTTINTRKERLCLEVRSKSSRNFQCSILTRNTNRLNSFVLRFLSSFWFNSQSNLTVFDVLLSLLKNEIQRSTKFTKQVENHWKIKSKGAPQKCFKNLRETLVLQTSQYKRHPYFFERIKTHGKVTRWNIVDRFIVKN